MRRVTSWRRLLLGLVGGLLLLVVLVFSYQAVRTVLALRDATHQTHQLGGEVRRNDVAAVEQTLRTLRTRSATAHRSSTNVLWSVAARVPLVGKNVAAVQVMARALDDVSSQAYAPAVKLLDDAQMDALRAPDGQVDLAAVARLEQPLRRLSKALDGAAHDVDAIDAAGLLGPLRDVTLGVQDELRSSVSATRGGVTVARLLPAMLGSEGPRHYLLVVQNNAEIRSTGGLPGSFMILNAQDGKLSLGTQRAVDDFAVLPTPVLPLTTEERALYGDNLGENIRDTTLTPDFPRAATLMAAMLKRSFGTDVDGVISVDPVVLSSVLRATGPIKVGEENFTARNVVRKLLNEVYQRFDTRAQQDVYFDGVARGIFDTLVTREVQPLKVLRKLDRSANQRRFLVWSSHPEEQQQLAGTDASGELPRDTGRPPHVGLYLNDGTAAKIEYYLDYRPSLRSAGCTARGAQTLQVGMTLSSSAPRRGFQLSSYVAGFGQYAARGTMRLNLRVYAPTGGQITSLVANGQPVPMVTREHDGRQVAIVTMFIRARQEVRLAAEFRTRAGQRGDPVLDWTPGVRTTSSGTTAASSC